MDELFKLYRHKIVRGSDESVMFNDFFEKNTECIKQWLDKRMERLQYKDNSVADKLREQANGFYKNKQFARSIEMYTKALCNAVPSSDSYSLIVANRSAALYMMGNYKRCLEDIDHVTSSNCPQETLMKVHIRKIKCCTKLKLKDKVKVAIREAINLLDKVASLNKVEKRQEIIDSSNETPATCVIFNEPEDKIHVLKDGINEHFLNTSSAIQLSYDKERGRHVTAKKQLEIGDVIFVEKPFIFAPVFANKNKDLMLTKCYNCLKNIFNGLPCKFCVKCVFCNETCRQHSWEEFHQWECAGMRANLWYEIGIAFPAMRALIKGMHLGFHKLNSDFEADTYVYGNEHDNYGYFNKLITNISKMDNVLPILISSAVIVLYLQYETEFFSWLADQAFITESDVDNIVGLVGSQLTKHIAQLQCNSSVIIENGKSIACAIYPSLSMTNHSCEPNIEIEYNKEVVIVRVRKQIKVKEEIFNCYGIDSSYMDRKTRQKICQKLYYFKCQCRACK